MKIWCWAMVGVAVAIGGCSGGSDSRTTDAADPPEVVVGERLFLETRFAQYFAVNGGERLNEPLAAGDPTMDVTATDGEPLAGPFAGQSMNCRACHLVDEQEFSRQVRTYADFARHSPIPARADGRTVTARNSPSLVGAAGGRSGLLLHFDGEFASTAQLVEGTLTGRNFGWLADERAQAVAHVAAVVRGDDGSGPIAAEFGAVPYAVLLLGTSAEIPADQILPEEHRIDVTTADDASILAAVARLISAYVDSLQFAQDANGDFNGSPYDVFLRKNSLPLRPREGQSNLDYARELRSTLAGRSQVRYVDLFDGLFRLHTQEFAFKAEELQGMQIFFAETGSAHVGNCIACHTPPAFTDFSFHNSGTTQDEYDAIHGPGAFATLDIPDAVSRSEHPEQFLPPSAQYPNAIGPFLSLPSVTQPGYTDLGLWNVYANPNLPPPQAKLQQLLCAASTTGDCSENGLLSSTIALFKTPSLRDLGQSEPYFHTGAAGDLPSAVELYRRTSALARSEQLRNAAPELAAIQLDDSDVRALAAFLRALNEDYD